MLILSTIPGTPNYIDVLCLTTCIAVIVTGCNIAISRRKFGLTVVRPINSVAIDVFCSIYDTLDLFPV